ncbi:hypothetical protein ACJIZ3_022986 [Penstemon smallii]|uniref:MPN domain-containing protein n=1 Tax=Penstemon smallii TaxID=265156 RepID=A0ABD3TNT8_9LAMI
MDVIKSQQISLRPIEKVVVHPLVLLSIVDHYNRVARDTRKRVVGVLLGTSYKGTVDVVNSYAVPFEEDDRDPSIWFLDHNYHESMFSMFRRINAKEHVVGWYSTGPKLKENDLNVHGLFNDYVPNPVLVIIDVQPKELGIPTKAYYAVEEVKENATQKSQKVFVHVPSEIAAHEVEEIGNCRLNMWFYFLLSHLLFHQGRMIYLPMFLHYLYVFLFSHTICLLLPLILLITGVEHLLRDVKDTTISTLATEVTGKLAALKGLDARLKEIRSYLDLVIEGKLPLNHEILYHLQDVFNLLPNLNVLELKYNNFRVRYRELLFASFSPIIYDRFFENCLLWSDNLVNRSQMLNKEHEKAEDSKPVAVPTAASS